MVRRYRGLGQGKAWEMHAGQRMRLPDRAGRSHTAKKAHINKLVSGAKSSRRAPGIKTNFAGLTGLEQFLRRATDRHNSTSHALIVSWIRVVPAGREILRTLGVS